MSALTGMLVLFVMTLAIGHWIRKNKKKEVYDYFVKLFGIGVAGLNFVAAFIIMLATDLEYVDRISTAFLSFIVGIIIMTLIKNNSKNGKN